MISTKRGGRCCSYWSSPSTEEKTISSLLEEPAAIDADGPGERGRQRQDPPEEELSLPMPAGAKNPYFVIVTRLGEEEGVVNPLQFGAATRVGF